MIRPGLAFALLLLAAAVRSPVAAQRPAELSGRVIDAAAGSAVEGARVEAVSATFAALTDETGAFVLRGLAHGEHAIRIERYGYADTVMAVTIVPGAPTVVQVSLRALPPELAALRIEANPSAGDVRIARAAIERSGARTAGDAIARVAGVVVRRDGAGGEETASVRGSDPSAVLVLVDGVPINDPVTGVADLSAILAASIESITVLAGARSARWGPRAAAGVIVVRTRLTPLPLAAELSIGSLGARGARVEAGGGARIAWQAGAAWRTLDGAFDFELPAEAGGGAARRSNADAEDLDLFAGGRATLAGGEVRVRASGGVQERGLPGKSFAPSPRAREAAKRARVVAGWERQDVRGEATLRLALTRQRLRFHDAAPSIGLPYDDTTHAAAAEAALGVERDVVADRLTVGAGGEARLSSIESARLRGEAPSRRWDVGAHAHAAGSARVLSGTVRLTVEGRLDREPEGEGGAVASHSVAVGWTRGGTSARVAHRSGYSPPALEDQFFRDAVGVEPNPDLRAERIPSEVALDVAYGRAVGRMSASATLAAWIGDVRGMIVWSPDYRFVWSPRNVDVRRRGLEASAGIESGGVLRSVRATYGYARIVYADAAGDAQLEYRPRHTAGMAVALSFAAWDAGIDARHTGERYPAAARVNALPGFWTVAADLRRSWNAGAWRVDAALHVDRVFDTRHTLIFGFPDPGRAAELRIRLSRTGTTGNDRS